MCCLLPKPNIDLLVVLLWFLREVSYHSAPTSQTSSVGDSTSLIHQVVIQQQQQHAAVAGVGGAGEEGDDVVDSATATGTGGGNKMDIDNLAVVIMPNILYAKSRNPVDDDTPHAIQAITMLLKYQNELWTVKIWTGERVCGKEGNGKLERLRKWYSLLFTSLLLSKVPDSVMNMLLDDMKGYDADIPDPTKEKEIMKKFENVMVR